MARLLPGSSSTLEMQFRVIYTGIILLTSRVLIAYLFFYHGIKNNSREIEILP